jgi:RNA polymerase sigma-70 factor, ECF subfamily
MQPPSRGDSDREAFEALVERYIDRLYGVAWRITGSPQDAEDAVQDALLSAYQHWGEFRYASSGETWLYRITINAALGRTRRRRPEDYLTDTGYADVRITDWSEDLAQRIEAAELRTVLEDGIWRLPEEFRVALVLRDVQGFSTAEAAEVLEISEAALKSRLHRARVLLRQYVSTFFDPPR